MAHVGRSSTLALSAAAALVLLVGCGGGTGSSSTSTLTVTTTTAATQPTQTASQPTTTGAGAGAGTGTGTAKAPTAESQSLAHSPRSEAMTKYGRPGPPSEKTAIAAIVKNYYAALAADRRGVLCALLSKNVVNQFRRELAEPAQSALLHSGPNKAFYHMSCTDLLTHEVRPPSPTQPKLAPMTLTEVRVNLNQGFAILRNDRNGHLKGLRIEREHGTWKINSLLATRIS